MSHEVSNIHEKKEKKYGKIPLGPPVLHSHETANVGGKNFAP